jgi:hypothetical protein
MSVSSEEAATRQNSLQALQPPCASMTTEAATDGQLECQQRGTLESVLAKACINYPFPVLTSNAF